MPQPFSSAKGSCLSACRPGKASVFHRKDNCWDFFEFPLPCRALVEMNDSAVGSPAPKGALIGLFLAGSHRDLMFRLGN